MDPSYNVVWTILLDPGLTILALASSILALVPPYHPGYTPPSMAHGAAAVYGYVRDCRTVHWPMGSERSHSPAIISDPTQSIVRTRPFDR